MNIIDTKPSIISEFTLPTGIKVNCPFDGALMGNPKDFDPGRTYLIRPIIEDLWPLVIYPLPESEDPCYEDSLFTCVFLDSNFQIIPWESYYTPENFNPITTNWVSKKLVNKAKNLNKGGE